MDDFLEEMESELVGGGTMVRETGGRWEGPRHIWRPLRPMGTLRRPAWYGLMRKTKPNQSVASIL